MKLPAQLLMNCSKKRLRSRSLGAEALERRDLLAVGASFSIAETFDTAPLSGDLTAVIDWGDGTQSTQAVSRSTGPLSVRVDYRFATAFFTQQRRDALELAAQTVAQRFGDTFAAINPGGGNTWTLRFRNPVTNQNITIPNFQVAANEIVLFALDGDLGGNLAQGGPGGGTGISGSPGFVDTVLTRGEPNGDGPGATDFGKWGGRIAFNSTFNWHSDLSPDGLENNEHDFFSVALHEMMHVLGFGTSDAWDTFSPGATFIGARATAEYDGAGSPPLFSDSAHWANELTDNGAETLMDPGFLAGKRKPPTPLDLAALDDIGWQLLDDNVSVSASHDYAQGGTYDIVVSIVDQAGVSVSETRSTGQIGNQAPTGISLASTVVYAGQPGSSIGRVAAADPDPNDTHTFTVNDPRFEVVNGWLKLKLNASIDASNDPISLDITAIDSCQDTVTRSFNLTVTTPTWNWHNAAHPDDVNGDGFVAANDVLVIVDFINTEDSLKLTDGTHTWPPYLDVSADDFAVAADVLQVVFTINNPGSTSSSASSFRAEPFPLGPSSPVTNAAHPNPAGTSAASASTSHIDLDRQSATLIGHGPAGRSGPARTRLAADPVAGLWEPKTTAPATWKASRAVHELVFATFSRTGLGQLERRARAVAVDQRVSDWAADFEDARALGHLLPDVTEDLRLDLIQ